jgi:hypothetical protein
MNGVAEKIRDLAARIAVKRSDQRAKSNVSDV